MMYSNLSVKNDDAVTVIMIARESKLNALNQDTLSELSQAVRKALEDSAIRGIVLTGEGDKAFVAGADIKEFADYTPTEGRQLAQVGQDSVFDLIYSADKPIVAAINGYALGGGLELALACHMRVASTSARLGLPEVSLGLIPGYGGTQRLTQLVGRGKAMEMILTGDNISADEAAEIGLVNYVVAPEELLPKSHAILQRIAYRSARAVSAAIRAVNANFECQKNGFKREIEEFSNCFGTPDFVEGVSAFLEKRKPNF